MNSRQFHIPVTLVAFLVFIAIVNGLAYANYWYWTMRWFDMPMHFAGGAWLAAFGVWWQYSRLGVAPKDFISLLGVCFIFAFGVGLLWEAYEAVVSFLTVEHINAMSDTLSDILFDILGGTIVAVFTWWRFKHK
ncbi:MAG: hypothetical protein AAB770_00510 [Patescibacteria group bacterium]